MPIFAFLIEVRLSLKLSYVRQEREKPECGSLGSTGCKSAAGKADAGTAARNCQERDSCSMGEDKEEKEDFKLIPSEAGKYPSEFRETLQPGKKSTNSNCKTNSRREIP